MWLETGERATNVLVFGNVLVNVLTGKPLPLTPGLWVHNALGFDWKPEAKCPRWERFLEEIFPRDKESADCVEELLGYCMTDETKFQKGACLIGKPRSGKGTVVWVLEQLVSSAAYISLSFHDWVGSMNSKEDLIGKRVGVFPDVRFKPGKFYGNSYDPGGIDHKSAELVLKITGEDALTIPRKYIGAWRGRLPMKIILLANDPLNLNDESGVLPTRFINIAFEESFLDREDLELRDKLRLELPGIAVRCLKAYRRLLARGRFIQPKSGLALKADIAAASDPFTAFVRDCFLINPESHVECPLALVKFQEWCRKHGRHDLLKNINKANFRKYLRRVRGLEHIQTFRVGHNGPRAYTLLQLRPAATWE